MKTLKHIFLLVLSLFVATSCMNDFDEPSFDNPPYGNNKIGEPNTTIQQLKDSFHDEIRNNEYALFTEETIIEGVVVANDETGNVYKQIVINDETGAIIIGIDDVGIYATLPIGQRVRINCKDLYIGGYGSLAQIGAKYYNTNYSEYQIGRMSKATFTDHVRLIGAPDPTQPGMTPVEITAGYLKDKGNKDLMPMYVVLKDVSFKEADGSRLYAPESEQISETNTAVERNVYVGGEKIIFRLSTYADFANEVMPTGKFDITGVLTRYRNPGKNSDSYDYWQFLLSSTDDLKPITEE